MIFTFDLEEDDRSLLRTFFKQLNQGFRQAIGEGRWMEGPRIRFPREGRRYLGEALDEAESEWRRIEAAIDEVSDATLRRFGMFGRSLRAKLHFVQHWSDTARGLLGPIDWFDLWDAIRRVLENLNIILESFYAATGSGELLKELKDLILHNSDPEDGQWGPELRPIRNPSSRQ